MPPIMKVMPALTACCTSTVSIQPAQNASRRAAYGTSGRPCQRAGRSSMAAGQASAITEGSQARLQGWSSSQ